MLHQKSLIKGLQRYPHFIDTTFWGCGSLSQAELTTVELILMKGLFDLAIFTILLFDIPSPELSDSAFPAGTPHTACCICCACMKMVVIAIGYFSNMDDVRGNHFHMLKHSFITACQWVWHLDKVVDHFQLTKDSHQ